MDITGDLPDVPATALAVSLENPGIVYVGTDIGVFVSTTGGDNWMTWNDGLPEAAQIADLSISPSNRAIRAATHSAGVYERTLIGLNPTSVSPGGTPIPVQVSLDQNYPNPFNPTTDIRYEITDYRLVKLEIFDLLGHKIATLVNKELGPGVYSAKWDARTSASGVYLYTLKVGNVVQTRKMVLLR
jgi:hypothetical protein